MTTSKEQLSVDNDVVVKAVNDIVNEIASNVNHYENRIGGTLYDAARKILSDQGVTVNNGEDGWYYLQP